MPVSTIHKLDQIILPGPANIQTLINADWTAGIETMLEHPAGFVFPMFRANKSQKPAISFTTPQLDTLLGAVPLTGLAAGAITTYFKLATQTANVARATATHEKIVVNSSLVYITQIRLPHNGRAEADVMIMTQYDGTHDNFVWTGSVALAGTLAASGYWGLGPVKINGTLVPGCQDATIDTGIKLIQAGASSEVFDTFVGIEISEPSVTIRTLQRTNWEVLGLRGTALDNAAGLKVFARKFTANGDRDGDASTTHCSFTGLLGTAFPVNSRGDVTGPISDTFRVELVSGTDAIAPLTSATGVIIA